MASLISPLVQVKAGQPAGDPKEGDLVTVSLSGAKISGARLTRISCGTYFVRLCGLDVPTPYQVGDRYPLSRDKIVDWQ